jgi:DNA topoisomerase-1
MSKKYKTTNTLLIVESPTKCKKIEEYLGSNYKCIASCGHLRELKSLEDIDFETFQLRYSIMETKKTQINNIKKAIKEADEVVIATDNDREGESIGWHICDIFHLNVSTTKRILFNEITEPALKKAISNPGRINMNIVFAQQTRQILDLLVGFEISPLLWKYISCKTTLSAGRCQTPALKLISDNKKEIDENPGIMVYKTKGYFEINHLIMEFELNKNILNKEEMIFFLNKTISFSHYLNCNSPIKKLQSPPSPLTTSSLQQKCSNELHLSPKETMKCCQVLYEKGYITYMRTDVRSYSNVFIDEANRYISNKWSEKYFNNQNQNSFSSSDEDAHESIRPTNISLENLDLIDGLSLKEKKIYKIIWQNTVESLMVSCSYYSIKAQIQAYNETIFTCHSEKIIFPGWKIVGSGSHDIENKEYNYLSNVKSKTLVSYSKITSTISIEKTKLHYTEAKLVEMLEEKEIGRPSTFASLVDKIQEREYVKKKDVKGKTIECENFELEREKDGIKEIKCKKDFGNEKSKLILQPIGSVVLDFLDKHFGELFQYDYTRVMEKELDFISQGNKNKLDICKKYYDQLINLKKKLNDEKNLDDEKDDCREKKLEIKMDEKHTFIIGKYGPVIKCIDANKKISFKPVKKDIDLNKLNELNLEDIIEKKVPFKEGLGEYEGFPLLVKKGKYGLYATWGKNTKSLKKLGNRPVENIKMEEVVSILQEK